MHASRPLRLALPIVVLAAGWTAAEDTARPPWDGDLDRVWEIVRDDFFDPDLRGIDWAAARERHLPAFRAAGSRAAAAAAINDMLSALDTSHTRFYTEADPAYYFLFDLFRDAVQNKEAGARRFGGAEIGYVGVGLFTERTDDGTFVRAVVDGGPADLAGVVAGDRILSVDDEPWRPVLPADRAGRAARMRIQRERDGTPLAVEVEPIVIRPVEFYLGAVGESARTIEREGRSVGYVRMWSYAGGEYHDLLTELVTTGSLSGADALIVDLRDGWGGASPAYLNLFNERIPELQSKGRGGEWNPWVPAWRKPVALLVDETTRSGKELLAFGFRRYGYGPVVGTRTAGAVTGGRAYAVGRDGLLYLAVRDIRVDGERLEGIGVEPDVVVPRELPYSAGRDPQLEAALSLLTQSQ